MRRLILAMMLTVVVCAPAHAARQYADITCGVSTTTGTGTLTLGAASGNYLAFSTQITDGSTVTYGITASDGKFETGVGVYTAAGTTLTRASSIVSTDGVGTKLTLPAGSHVVCVEFNSVWFQPDLGTGDSPTFNNLALAGDLSTTDATFTITVDSDGTPFTQGFGSAMLLNAPGGFAEVNFGSASAPTVQFITTGSTGPSFTLMNNDPTPDAFATTGFILFRANNNTPTDVTVAQIQVGHLDTTPGSEDEQFFFKAKVNGSDLTYLNMLNSTIVPGTDAAIDLGSSTLGWRDIYLTRNLELGGSTSTTITEASAGLISVEGAVVATGAPDVQTMTATGSGDSWDKPTGGQRMCQVQIWGAGGSGGRGAASQAAAGGGGGAYQVKFFRVADLGSTETVSIASGGAAQSSATTDGNAGGNTTFGSGATLVTAYGGGGGDGSVGPGSGGGGGGGATAVGAVGNALVGGASDGVIGSATVAVSGPYGGAGGNGVAAANAVAGGIAFMGGGGGGGSAGDATSVNAAGGASVYGGGGGGAGAEDAAPGAGAGGTSSYGGAGGAGGNTSGTGTAGTQPGGGGGGAASANSGKGGDGKAIITCW